MILKQEAWPFIVARKNWQSVTEREFIHNDICFVKKKKEICLRLVNFIVLMVALCVYYWTNMVSN